LQDALSRIARPSAAQVLLMNGLADSWEQDQNLLQALAWREKAAVAIESVPPPIPGAPVRAEIHIVMGPFASSSGAPDRAYIYGWIAHLNQLLGRPEARAANLEKLRVLAKNDLSTVAALYQEQGRTDDAIRAYQHAIATVTANPQAQVWEIVRPYQGLATLYDAENRYDEAVATMKHAIEAVSAFATPEAKDQVTSMRSNLAILLSQTSDRDAADRVYQQLLAESPAPNAVTNYASHLISTGRAAEAVETLKTYVAAHAELDAWQEADVLHTLSNAARAAGDPKGAEEYQRLAAEKRPLPPPQISIGKDLQAANEAAHLGKAGDAIDLAIRAMDASPGAIDRDQIGWQIPNLAQTLAGTSPDKAEQLYQRLFGLVDSWSSDTVQPQLQVLGTYVHFLRQQKSRSSEVPGAIERDRNAVAAAHGPNTGAMADVFRLSIQQPVPAIPAVRDLLALEQSLSGTTSESYLRAVETAAIAYEQAGDRERVAALRRQSVGIADVALPPDDARRGQTRVNTAFALLKLGQIDEAERLAKEAASIEERLRGRPKAYAGQLQQIREIIERMKK